MIITHRRHGGSSRPVIQKAHDYRGERVHLALDPAFGDPIPLYQCDRCKRSLSADQFKPIACWRQLGPRVSKFRTVVPLHPHCNLCRKQAKGAHVEHPLYSPELDTFFRNLVNGARSGAHQRGILFALDKDDAIGLYLEQGGTCSLTGIPLNDFAAGTANRNGRNYRAPSIDRIDSSGNYTLGNVQIVMQVVNIMKNDLPQDRFISLCRRIADHNFSL